MDKNVHSIIIQPYFPESHPSNIQLPPKPWFNSYEITYLGPFRGCLILGAAIVSISSIPRFYP